MQGSGGDRIQWMKQGAAAGCVAEALPAAETTEAEQGQRSVFYESAATLEAKAGYRNPEQRSNFHKDIHVRRENWLSARGTNGDRVLRTKQGAVSGAAV